MSHTSSNRVYECEVCGSTDRVSYHGMDSSLLCWKHMLEANRREDAAANAIPNRVCGKRSGAYKCVKDKGHGGRHVSQTGVVWDATPKRAAKLHGKYFGLRRTRDGSEVEGFYFVLREDDPHAQAALEAYATSCEAEAPELAADLRGVVKDAQTLQGLHDAGWER